MSNTLSTVTVVEKPSLTITREDFLKLDVKQAANKMAQAIHDYVNFKGIAEQLKDDAVYQEKYEEYKKASHDALGQYQMMSSAMTILLAKTL